MASISIPAINGLFDQPAGLGAVLDKIPLALSLLDLDRRLLLVNQAMRALTGFVQEGVLGLPCYHVLRSNICLQRCPLLSMREEFEPACMEGDIINRDRQKVPVRVTVAPIKDINGKRVGFMEAVEDIRLIKELDGNIEHAYSFGDIIGRSPQMEKIFKTLPIIAQTDSSVLITGETGTGKDLIAEAIHKASNQAKGPFIKVNCGALPETLMESELFGHQKGAFTGAVENKPGRFRLAHNGVLYLTEIGDLPLPLQVKLLTFLDDKVVYPLGSTKGFQANVRVIAATHRNLEQMVREGSFRQDLLFRLNVVRLHLPPIRERGDDIRLLIDHFFHLFISRFNKKIKGFSKKALKLLLAYHYPGNVRELRNIVEYAVNVCQTTQVNVNDLPYYLMDTKTWDQPLKRDEDQRSSPVFSNTLSHYEEKNENWATVERRMIMEALLKVRGHRGKAALLLGWGRSTLWRKMKQYGIDA